MAKQPSRPSAPQPGAPPAPAADTPTDTPADTPPEAPPLLADMLDMVVMAPHPAALRRLLTAAELPMQGSVVAADAGTAVRAAGQLRYPVALRLVSPDIPDPGAIGCVLDRLDDRVGVDAGFRTLVERARAAKPGARVLGVALAPAITDGIACRIGMRRAAAGAVVWLALPGADGAAAAEPAASERPAPFGAAGAQALIRAHPGFALLDGSAGRPRADIGALAEVLARLSVLAALAAGRVKAVEIDPLLVRPEGKGVVAVDARIEL